MVLFVKFNGIFDDPKHIFLQIQIFASSVEAKNIKANQIAKSLKQCKTVNVFQGFEFSLCDGVTMKNQTTQVRLLCTEI